MRLRLRHWIIGGAFFALLVGVPFALAQLPNTLTVRAAPSGTAPAVLADGLDANISINLIPKGTGTVQINGTPVVVSGGTFTSLNVNPGPLNVTGTTNLTGPLFMTPGTSVTLERVGAAVLFNSSADFSPAALATEEDAYNFVLPANVLSANNQYLKIEWLATTAANANTKQVRLRFGATLVCDTTLAAFNAQRLSANVTIWRTGAATQKAICVGSQSAESSWATAAGGGSNFTTPAETLSGPVTIRVTVQATTVVTDVVARGVNMLWYPAGQ